VLGAATENTNFKFATKEFVMKLNGFVVLSFLILALGFTGCGGGSSAHVQSVQVTPKTVTLLRGATQSFAAAVTGTENVAVTWSVEESGGGTIDSSGVYTAPQNAEGTYHVVATSKANSGAQGNATVIVPVPQVKISPGSVTLVPGGAQTFSAAVVGLANMSVIWTVQEAAGGQINGAGFYSAPIGVGFYHVVATSVEDTTVTATSTITVTTSSGLFTPTGSLQKGRGDHTATLLADGKVLVAGGANRAVDHHCLGGIASAELYDPVAGTFASTGTLTSERYAHSATLLQNGRVLVAGGFGNTNDCQDVGVQAQNTAELYDPVTGLFTSTGNMNAVRSYHTATPLENGKVLVTGGSDSAGNGSARAELYDPKMGTFTTTGSMATARFRHTATLLPNGKVLVVGGGPSFSNPTSSAEVYDPATGGFTVTGGMTTAREGHTATVVADGKVLIVGGVSPIVGSGDLLPTATAEVYDPSVGSFSVSGSMTAGRSYHTATLLPSGKVLLAGGGADNSTAELYDPMTSAFSITGAMEVGRSGHSATLLTNGSALVAGGDGFGLIATAELYK
jgi:hypothetical protein